MDLEYQEEANNESDDSSSDFEVNNNLNFFSKKQHIKQNEKKMRKKSKELKKEQKKESQDLSQKQESNTKNQNFKSLGLSKNLIKACEDLKYEQPTPIQQLSIPAILSGKDVLANSVTGSGKTAAFLLPILQKLNQKSLYERNYSSVLILIPTRELALQVQDMLTDLNKYVNATVSVIIGKQSIQVQESELRKHPDIIIATPGRIIDILKNSQSFNLDDLEILVFDEADKLFEHGFQSEILELVKELNQYRQTLLFSATLTSDIKNLTKVALNKPIRIKADPERATSKNLKQYIVQLESDNKSQREGILLYLCKHMCKSNTIIFFNTKKQCHRMSILLQLANLNLCELHGELSQNVRIESFQKLKNNEYNFMLTTDLGARGIDLENIEYVINFELPHETTRYIHRVGRTARIGKKGISISICNKAELNALKRMLRETKDQLFNKKIGPQTISKYANIIQSFNDDYNEIIKSQKIEKEIEQAEMEVKKAENLMKYKDQIYNRPKKQWLASKSYNEKQSKLEYEQDFNKYQKKSNNPQNQPQQQKFQTKGKKNFNQKNDKNKVKQKTIFKNKNKPRNKRKH